MNKETAKQIPIAAYLASKHILPQRKQQHSLWYLSPFREETQASFKVNLQLNRWHDFGGGNKGDIFDLVMALEQIRNLNAAIRWLSQHKPHLFSFRGESSLEDTEAELKSTTNTIANNTIQNLQVKPLKHLALLQLLEDRKIPIDLAKSYCKEVHYALNGKHYFAIGFANNEGGYATLNSYFKGCIAPNGITSITAEQNKFALVFEGFMDFLSYLTLKQRQNTHNPIQDYHILNSVRNVEKLLPNLEKYEKIYCFLDNDKSGKQALQNIQKHLGNRVIDQSNYYKNYKDLNDYLCRILKKAVAKSKQHPKPKMKR